MSKNPFGDAPSAEPTDPMSQPNSAWQRRRTSMNPFGTEDDDNNATQRVRQPTPEFRPLTQPQPPPHPFYPAAIATATAVAAPSSSSSALSSTPGFAPPRFEPRVGGEYSPVAARPPEATSSQRHPPPTDVESGVVGGKQAPPEGPPLPVCYTMDDKDAVIRFLMSDRVYGYPYTSGGPWSNYLRFVLSKHPLISIVFHYRVDPYNSKKRFIVFCCTLCLAVAASFLLNNTTFIYQIALCRDGCTTDSSGTCVGGLANGKSYSMYWEGCRYYQNWMLPFLIGAVLVVYSSILQFFARCGCVVGRAFFRENCCGNSVRLVLEFFGGGMLFFFSVLSLAMIVWVVAVTYFTQSSFNIFVTILISKGWSFLQWFAYTLPYFFVRYPFDKSHFVSKAKKALVEAEETSGSNEAAASSSGRPVAPSSSVDPPKPGIILGSSRR